MDHLAGEDRVGLHEVIRRCDDPDPGVQIRGPVLVLAHRSERIARHAAAAVQAGHTADDLIVEHATMRIQAEIDWHEKVLADIDKLDTPPS